MKRFFGVVVMLMVMACSSIQQRPDAGVMVDPLPPFTGGFLDLSEAVVADPAHEDLVAFPRVRKPFEPCGPPICLEQPTATTCVFGPVGSGQVIMGTAVGNKLFQYDVAQKRLVLVLRELPQGTILAWLDIDGDGAWDLVYTDGMQTMIQWGAQGRAPTILQTTASAVHVVDLNNDGLLDIMIGTQCQQNEEDRGSVRVFFQGPAYVFTERAVVHGNWCHSGYAVWAGSIKNRHFIIAATGEDGTGDQTASMYHQVGIGAGGFPIYQPWENEPRVGYYGPEMTPGLAKQMVDRACATGRGVPQNVCATLVTPEQAFAYVQARIAEPTLFSSHAPMGIGMYNLNGGDASAQLLISLHSDHYIATDVGGPNAVVFQDITKASGLPAYSPDEQDAPIPWAVVATDLLKTGLPGLVFTAGHDYGAFSGQWALHTEERTRFYANLGSLKFQEIEVGISRAGQWMSLAVGDLLGRGVPDLCVGGQGELPRLYLNEINSGNNGLALRLKGRTSNSLGIGAQVRVEVSGLPAQYFRVGSTGSPYVLSEPLVFVGLGKAEQVDRVLITWPSDRVQEVHSLVSGRVHDIVEP